MAALKDIATAAGVSIRTVNRVLNDDARVAEATRTAVLDCASRLGYRPNRIARSLRTGKSHIITAVIGRLDELHQEKVAAFEETLRASGFAVELLFGPRNQDEGQPSLLDEIRSRRSAAVALFPGHGLDINAMENECAGANLPLVSIDASAAGAAVCIDRQQGVYEAVQYLYSAGRRRIAYLGSIHDETRLGGYRRAIRELELDEMVLNADRGREEDQFLAGRNGVEACLRCGPRPDAVQVYSDRMAMGFLAGLHDRGLRAPDDMAVVGFDARPASALASPPLTTVAQPNREVGIAAAEILLEAVRLAKLPDASASRTLPTRLLLRESA